VPDIDDLENIEKMLKDIGEREREIGVMEEKPVSSEKIEEELLKEEKVEEVPEEKPEFPSEVAEDEEELKALLKDIEIGIEQEKELEEKLKDRGEYEPEEEPGIIETTEIATEEKIPPISQGEVGVKEEAEEVMPPEEIEEKEIESEKIEGLKEKVEPAYEKIEVPEEAELEKEGEEGGALFDLPEDFDLDNLIFEEKPPQALMEKETPQPVISEAEEVKKEEFYVEEAPEALETEGISIAEEEVKEPAEELKTFEVEEKRVEVPEEEFELPELEEIMKETGIEEFGEAPPEIETEQPVVAGRVSEEVREEVIQPPEKEVKPFFEGEEEAPEEEIELSDEDIVLIKTKLKQLAPWIASMVRNIIVGEELSVSQMKVLLNLLIQDASQNRIVNYIEEFTGRRIAPPPKPPRVVPAVRKPGIFAVALENLTPIVRIAGLFVIIAALIGSLFMVFIFRPLKANRYYREGIELIKMGEYELAEQSFNRAVEIYEAIKEYDNFGWEYALSANYDLAIAKFVEGIKKDEAFKNIDIRLHLAKIYNVLGRYEEADKLYDKVIVRKPKIYEYKELKGENLIDWGVWESEKLDQAYELFKTEYTEDPRNSNPVIQMLYIDILRDNRESVDSLYEYIKKRFPKVVDDRVFTALGSYYLDKNHLEPVRDILSSVFKTFARYPEAYFQFSRYYRAINNKAQEEELLKLTIEAEKVRELRYPWEKRNYILISKAYNNLGELYIKFEIPGKIAEAVNYFQQAIEADPGNRDAYFNLGQAYFYKENNYQLALRNYEKALSMGYKSNDLYYNLGVLYFFNHSFDKALNNWSLLSEVMSDNPNVTYAIGTTLLHLGKYNSALGEFLMLSEVYDRLVENLGEIRPWSAYHRQILLNAAAVYNNLGVAYQKLYETTGKSEYQSQSLVSFYKGGELADIIGVERGKIQYNINYILHPEVIRGDVAINDDIVKDYRFEAR